MSELEFLKARRAAEHMAPEQLEGKEADARSDIYAFGAVLYEMVTGRRVYDEEQRRTLSPRLLQTIVSKALSKSAEDRWQSVRDCIASRGVWDVHGRWLPVPYIDTAAVEKLFRHKTLRLLKRRGLLSDERIELLHSFRNTGFSVDDSPTLWPQDSDGLERLARYLLRCPLSLSRIHWTKGARTLFYEGKSSHDDPHRPKNSTPPLPNTIAKPHPTSRTCPLASAPLSEDDGRILLEEFSRPTRSSVRAAANFASCLSSPSPR